MREEGNQRRLVDVSPLQVLAARHVIELIAEVAVAVVEVEVKDEFGERDGPDDGHAGDERGRKGSLFVRRSNDGGWGGQGATIISDGVEGYRGGLQVPARMRTADRFR